MIEERARLLGEGALGRLLWQFSLPAIVGMLAQALYNLVDRVFVGQALGPDGIAGITVAFPFMLILLALGMLVGFGATALISIRLGQQRPAEAEQILGNAFVLLVFVSLATTAAGLLWLDRLLVLFGASPAVLPYGRDYMRIIACGTIFQVVGFGLNAAIRGEGNPRVAMLTMLIGVGLNTLLAPWFIFGFGWGMRGAGLATVLSQAVGATWVIAHFLGRRSMLKLRWRNLHLEPAVCRDIALIGFPPFAMQVAGSVLQSVLNNQLRHYGGDLAISVMGIIYASTMLVAMPIFGINQGAQPIIGFNYGAGRLDRVRGTLLLAIGASSALCLLGFLVTMTFPREVIRLFAPRDEAIAALGSRAMRISIAMLPVIGFQVVSASYFQAVGKPREATLLMLSRQVLLLIPAVLILPHFFGLDGVWLALPTADLGSAILTGACLAAELRHLGRPSPAASLRSSPVGPGL